MFENYAQKYIDNALQNVDLNPFDCYQSNLVIRKKFKEINELWVRFEKETNSYSKFIEKFAEAYKNRLNAAWENIENENERKGNTASHTYTLEKKGKYYSWCVKRGTFWWSDDCYKWEREYLKQTVTVLKNGNEKFGQWQYSHTVDGYFMR